ncbi:aldehyde dehydrogenase family protein [Alkalibacterium gilvum]|uniref:Aldehyde dehydrogenase n=1 Tax=Alkalibacterium gilvum TaxID=1130080 RepID=A0A1H6S489_9LACT|nr:aldehyde dehydrogenase family protein [Alkalibacterium gilvum]SEI61536.1 aldehyde dehydrogenase (NAD+) [Alkalibacterium gilvum]
MTDSNANKEKWLMLQEIQKEQVTNYSKANYSKRIDRLNRLKKIIKKHEREWLTALNSDLGKSEMESFTSEIATTLNELDYVKNHLRRWMETDENTKHTVLGKVEQSILNVPYGSILIISPWNYPLQLTFVPLIGAIAAGNRCFIKPSEKSPAVSQLVNKLISSYFDPEEIFVVEGEADTAQALLTMNWDYIFFTGSSLIGRKVYEAASRTLTPITLELGGKNPCIVDETHCTKETVQKIIWGKFLNAGQTCIAPDTVYVHKAVEEKFTRLAIETIRDFYGREPEKSSDYSRLVDSKHFDKIKNHLTQGDIIYGGSGKRDALFIEPTLMNNIKEDTGLAKEEVFGPILPIIAYESSDRLLTKLNKQAAPLVTYLFSDNPKYVKEVNNSIKTGALVVNQVILHVASSKIPFGGVGNSGIGSYHGYSSYKTFTYEKVLYNQKKDYANKALFPPHKSQRIKLFSYFRKWFT